MNESNSSIDYEMSLFKTYSYIGLNLFGILFGTIGNIMIIGAILCTKKLQNSTSYIIFNLAVSDLMVSSLSNCLAIVGVLYGKSFFDDKPFLCKICAMICRITCATAFVNIVILSIVRYFYVCNKDLYNKYFSLNRTKAYCLITWIIGFCSDFPNQLVPNGHHFDKMVQTCIFDHKIIKPATYFFSIALMVLPCFCIMYFYLHIFAATLQAKLNTSDEKRLLKVKKSLQVSKGLFASFIIFTLCVLPYAIVMMSDFETKLPVHVHMFLFLLARLNSSLNPILYGATNPLFQNGYRNFLVCITSCSFTQTKSQTQTNLKQITKEKTETMKTN